MDKLDDIFEQIEETVKALEDPDISIEDAFDRYEKGMKLLKTCSEKIDTMEKKVLEIGADGELHEFK